MIRDWVFTLLALSPAFLAAAIVALALIGKAARSDSDRPAATEKTRHAGGLR